MRQAIDTFLHYLADNLTGLNIHPLRFDKNDPAGVVLQGNAVNVHFSNSTFTTLLNEQLVTIDICHEEELIARDWAEQVSALLLSSAYTQKMDYSSGTGVDAQDGFVYWNTHIVFRSVEDLYYHRLTTNIKLFHK